MRWETLEVELNGLIDTNILFYEEDNTFICELHILTRDKIDEAIINIFAGSYWRTVKKNKIILQ